MGGVCGEEAFDGVRGAFEDYLDVGVAGGPEVVEERFGELLGEGRGGVAKIVEGFAEGEAPLLIPADLAAVAAAVGAPTLDAVRAAPGGIFGNFSLPFGGKHFEELAVVRELGGTSFSNPVHGVGEGHFAVFVMMTVALAVSGDVRDLCGFRIAGRGGMEAGEETLAEVFAAVEQALKGDGAGVGAIVEEDGDAATLVEAHEIGMSRVDVGVGGLTPGGFVGCGGQGADARALYGGEDGELDALLRHKVEDASIDGSFCEPHAFGFA